MLDPDHLTFAIEIQKKSYRMLRWIADAVDAGKLPVHLAARHDASPAGALTWLARNHALLPDDAQVDPEDLDALGNFFWTYLVTSFDVVEDPGRRGRSAVDGCSCELCVVLVDSSHLRPKKLRSRDKRQAMILMQRRVIALGESAGRAISSEEARELLLAEDRRRAAAYSAYGSSLLGRLHGDTDGPAVLALWREIAWLRSGSPNKQFQLRTEDFVAAEERLVDAVQGLRLVQDFVRDSASGGVASS